MTARAYFDHAATTPLDARVRAAMAPWLAEEYGNPSSLHGPGRAARAAVDAARQQVGELVGAAPEHVFFTAGGTEADNLALAGLANAAGRRIHIVTSAIEHPAVLETCRALVAQGRADVTLVRPESDGAVRPEAVAAALRPDTALVSVMAANNVTGVLQPLAALAATAHRCGALFHTDAVQAAGMLPLSVERDEIDLLTLSAHKLHGPKGVGALVTRCADRLAPVIYGGGQERGLRSGTENVPAIVGFGAAAEIARTTRGEEAARLVGLREQLLDGVLAAVPAAYVIGDRRRRLPGHICLGFDGLEGESITLMLALDEAGFAVSTGSACSAHKASEPSYVLQAMGFDAFRARGALRITLGRGNTAAEVDRLINGLPGILGALRPISSRAGRLQGVR